MEETFKAAIAEAGRLNEITKKQELFTKKLNELADLEKEVLELSNEIGVATGRLQILTELMKK